MEALVGRIRGGSSQGLHVKMSGYSFLGLPDNVGEFSLKAFVEGPQVDIANRQKPPTLYKQRPQLDEGQGDQLTTHPKS